MIVMDSSVVITEDKLNEVVGGLTRGTEVRVDGVWCR